MDAPHSHLPADADAAIRQLYSDHAEALSSYVRRFCLDQAGADDIVQETFIRAWRHLPQLRGDGRPVRSRLHYALHALRAYLQDRCAVACP